jgi:hypothetical protein
LDFLFGLMKRTGPDAGLIFFTYINRNAWGEPHFSRCHSAGMRGALSVLRGTLQQFRPDNF